MMNWALCSSAALSLPLVTKGPARERCLWQSKRPQRLGSHLLWQAAKLPAKA